MIRGATTDRDRRRRRGHVGGVPGPTPARTGTTWRSSPSSGGTSRPTRPAASRTGSAGWWPTRDELVARDPETFRDDVRDRRAASRHEVTADRPRPPRGGRPGPGRDGGEVRERVRPAGVRRRRDAGASRRGPAPTRAACSACRPSTTAPRCATGWTATPKPRRAVVVGGGYIGVEMAEALIKRGLSVTLVEQADQPMSTVDPDMAATGRRGDARPGHRHPHRRSR